MHKLFSMHILFVLVSFGLHINNYGMISTLRSKLPQTITTPRALLSRYYSRYQPAMKPQAQKQTQPTFSTQQPQARSIHTTSAPSFRATQPSLFSEWVRWFQSKPTAQSMFTLFDQFLKDGSGFDALMNHIKNGDYDEIINTTKEGIFFAEDRPSPFTILDQALSELIKANKFGARSMVNVHTYPNLTYADFFNINVTPKLVQLIEELLAKNAKTTIDITTIFWQIASYYWLISRGILPPKDPVQKQAFFDYLSSLKRIAKYIYDAYKINIYASFDNAFNASHEYKYSSKERDDWVQEQANTIIERINAGEYQEVLHQIQNNMLDDIISESYKVDYFFAGSYGHWIVTNDILTLLDRVLQVLLKAKTLRSPTAMQGKLWSDIFDPQKDPQRIEIAKALAEKPWRSETPEKRVEELLAYVLSAEYNIKPPADPVIAQQYKEFLQSIKDIAKKLFEARVRFKQDPQWAAFDKFDIGAQFEAHVNRYRSTWSDFVVHVRKKFNIEQPYTQYKPVFTQDTKTEALKTLGFKPDEQPTEPQLKERIKELRLKFHPDIARGEGKPEAEVKQAEEKLKEMHRAYDILTTQ